MGVSYSSAAIIGICIPSEKLFKEVKIKAFDHSYPDDYNVDPVSGKQLWDTLELCIIEEFNGNEKYARIIIKNKRL